jgi:DNA gyrase subunit B
MSEPEILNYDESNIQTIEGALIIRLRPTIFIGALGEFGTKHLFTEAIANSIDEFCAGRCNFIDVNIDSIKHVISVEDNGPGIPIGKLEDAIIKPFTGGKYTKNAYSISTGINGVGLSCISALSDMMSADVYRDNKWAHGEFPKGETKCLDITDCTNHHTGTKIVFRPDITVLHDITMQYTKYVNDVKAYAYLNPGLTIAFTFDDKEHRFYQPNGLSQYFIDEILIPKKIQCIPPKAISISGKTSIDETVSYAVQDLNDSAKSSIKEDKANVHMEFEAYFSWSDNYKGADIESFVNGMRTKEGGTHVNGLTSAISDSIRKYFQRHDILPKNSQFSIEAGDIKETLIGLISVKHSHPLYATQVKEALTNPDIQDFIRTEVSAKFTEWLELNQTIASRICSIIMVSAKARFAAANARKAVKASAATTNHTALIGIDKYCPCRSRDPEKCELFLVEGESAGGSAKSGGNGEFQAIYKLRGVPANVYDSQDITKYLNTDGSVIGDLVKVLGCGMGKSFDITKLRFHKIVIMTDADPDGSHISSLLLGFFYSFYPELIESGKIYLANPPLFRFDFGKGREIFIPNMNMYWKILDDTTVKEFDICYHHNGKGHVIQNEKFFRQYLIYLRDYHTTVEVASKQVNIHPELLEYIITNYDKLMKKDKFRLHGWEFIRYFDNKIGCDIIEGIYDNVFHKIELTDFLMQSCTKMIDQLVNIKWSNLILRYKKNGVVLGPSPYQISKLIDKIVNSSVVVGRFKGLGEMSDKQLWDTTMNPATRTLTKVTMDAAKTAYYDERLDIFIGKDIAGRKEFYKKYL